jgi:hypothetical protein
MFGQLRPNGRVAYVVAQHMGHSAHADLVVRAIARGAALPVHLGRDGQALEPDAIYVIPGDCDGIVRDGSLALLPRDTTRISTPSVDVLLQSLADNLGQRGWAVILSGTGRDGALGCRAVQLAGGAVAIQAPSEAGFSGMPDAVLEPGGASVTLPAGEIGAWLEQRLDRHAALPMEDEVATEGLAPMIARIRQVTGIDFSGYREETLWRRLNSRRSQLALAPEAYEHLLLRDPHEAQQLQRLFLVSVSWCWRDRESFEALRKAVNRRLATKPAGEPLRAWVAGCASGEEAYTLAALLCEAVERQGIARPIDILATDLSQEALSLARAGEYPHKAFREAPAGWADRWFTPMAGGYRVGADLSSCVRFAASDVESATQWGLQDGAVDLVSCRNLLIYFMRHKQDRVVARFRHALAPEGLLFLGLSENLSPGTRSSFLTLDPDHRLFSRRA